MSIPFRPRGVDYASLAALAVAAAGYWSAWLTHPAAALRLNAFELAEWITFLPAVRDGSLRLSRLSFLAPQAALAVLLAIAAARGGLTWTGARGLRVPVPASPLGWGLLAGALLCGAAVFPGYPYILTAYADPEFQWQFFAACAALAGLLLVQFLPGEVNDWLQWLLAGGGGALAAWALLAVRPAAAELLNAPWPLGAGWALTLAGFAGLVIAAWARIFVPRP